MSRIEKIIARPILNSKGDFTIEAIAYTENAHTIKASIPAGTSTGTKEAKYTDIHTAINTIMNKLANKFIELVNNNIPLKNWHEYLKSLDNSEDKHVLGANVFLVMEVLYLKSLAVISNKSLYTIINQEARLILSKDLQNDYPTPLFNIINGGLHAYTTIPFQEFWVIPTGIPNTSQKILAGVKIYHKLKELLKKHGYSTLTGLEGGFAPNFPGGITEALDMISKAVEEAGYSTQTQIKFGIDAAATNFSVLENKTFTYKLYSSKPPINHDEYLKFWNQILDTYPLILVEDPLHEQAPFAIWEEFLQITKQHNAFLIGDDLTVTSPSIIQNAIKANAINGAILKPNQIGSVVETIQAFNVLEQNNATSIVSHRSGETNDAFITDLAVALATNYLKAGAPAHGERVTKYNRLLEIELELGL